jgi:hypothetical protein
MDIEKFYEDFNFAQTADEKRKLIEYLNNEVDFSEEELKELYEQINDLVQNSAFEEDQIISLEIEEGKYQLYTCIKSIDSYNAGSNYYVSIDDIKDFYLSTGIGETNSIIQNMIDSIKPIYYIVVDDGIGTLKRKNIFSKDVDFSNYFTKFA